MLGRDYVEHIKSQDVNNVGLPTLLMHSPDKLLPRLAAAWVSVSQRLCNPGLQQEIPTELPTTERTRYLWACIEPDPMPVWAEAAGLPCAPHVTRAMLVLLDNGAVFPDGGLSDWVKRYLEAETKRFGIDKPEAAEML